VCCLPFSYQAAFCNVDERDIKRLGSYKRNVMYADAFSMFLSAIDGGRHPSAAIKTKIVEQQSGPFKGREVCMCACLGGTPMKSVRCLVYKDRPKICLSVVKPGDSACLKARKYWRDVARDQCGWKG
jgi:hypothetical protein